MSHPVGLAPPRIPVVAVGPVPPPVHGQAVADQLLFEGRYRRLDLTPVGLRFSGDIVDVGRPRLGKVATLVRAVVDVHRARRRSGARTLVYSVGVKNLVGVVRDTVLLLTVRPTFDRTVLHVHTGGVGEVVAAAPWPLRALARRAYGRTQAVIHLSPNPPEAVFTTERWSFLPNGVDAPEQVRDAALTQSLRDDGKTRVLFLGNLYESKGPGVLLEACERLVADGFDLDLVLAGDAPDPAYAARLEHRIADPSLSSRVRRTGPLGRDEAWAAMVDADIFCFPTYYEGESLPLVVIEAMACGRPVVASDWRSIDQLVDDGRTGLLVPPKDPFALADALAGLLADPERARSMGRAGRLRYEEAFTVERFRRGFEDAVLAVAGRSPSESSASVTAR